MLKADVGWTCRETINVGISYRQIANLRPGWRGLRVANHNALLFAWLSGVQRSGADVRVLRAWPGAFTEVRRARLLVEVVRWFGDVQRYVGRLSTRVEDVSLYST